MIKFGAAALAAMALGLAAPAEARVLDHIQLNLGVSLIAPDEGAEISTIGGDADISDEIVPTIGVEYFFNDNVSAELMCCMARHDVAAVNTNLPGSVDLGEVSHFPPTITLKYHWTDFGAFQPYVGAGVNYTHFFDAELPAGGAVTGIDYEDSFGAALQAGFDYRVNERWSAHFDVRRIWINTDATIDALGTTINADVDINPWVVTAGIGLRF
ncbi:MAG: OmpW family protein [Hyphomonadaceae bacterium]